MRDFLCFFFASAVAYPQLNQSWYVAAATAVVVVSLMPSMYSMAAKQTNHIKIIHGN